MSPFHAGDGIYLELLNDLQVSCGCTPAGEMGDRTAMQEERSWVQCVWYQLGVSHAQVIPEAWLRGYEMVEMSRA